MNTSNLQASDALAAPSVHPLNKEASREALHECKRNDVVMVQPAEYVSAPNPAAMPSMVTADSDAGSEHQNQQQQKGTGMDVNRMSKVNRKAHFADQRKSKEREAMLKMGLNPEDFPSALSSAVRKISLTPSAPRREPIPRESSNDDGGPWGDLQQQNFIAARPSAGYGEEHVSGWGSSSSSSVSPSQSGIMETDGWNLSEPIMPSTPTASAQTKINAQLDSPPGFTPPQAAPSDSNGNGRGSLAPKQGNTNYFAVSGWSLNEPTPTAPTYAPQKPAPVPIVSVAPIVALAVTQVPVAPRNAPVAEIRDAQTALAVSDWDIPDTPFIPQAAAPAVVKPVAVAETSSDVPSWSIDPAPSNGLPERRPLYSYNPEQIQQSAGPSKPVVSIPAPAAAPVPPQQQRAPVVTSPYDYVDSWGTANPMPTTAPIVQSDPVPVAAPVAVPVTASYSLVPAPQQQYTAPPRRPEPSALPQMASVNPLDYVDSWDTSEPMPIAPITPVIIYMAPTVITTVVSPIAPQAPAPVQSARVELPVQATQQYSAPDAAPSIPQNNAPSRPPKAANLLDYVDGWGVEEAMPTAPASAPTPVVAAPVVHAPSVAPTAIYGSNIITCPSCQHHFSLPNQA